MHNTNATTQNISLPPQQTTQATNNQFWIVREPATSFDQEHCMTHLMHNFITQQSIQSLQNYMRISKRTTQPYLEINLTRLVVHKYVDFKQFAFYIAINFLSIIF